LPRSSPSRGRHRALSGEVRLGGTLPLSGADAPTGASFREGYEPAVEQANQRGGAQVGGKCLPVKLSLRDDAGDKAAGVSGAEHLLADDSADFLLGTFNSSMVEVQSVVAEKHGVPYVAGGASTQSCTRGTCATSSDSRRR
jgi:branched-chain amino acid transport system substrate-binding protein